MPTDQPKGASAPSCGFSQRVTYFVEQTQECADSAAEGAQCEERVNKLIDGRVRPALNELENSCREETRRLERFECEVRQQVLEQREQLACIQREVDAFQQLHPKLQAVEDGLACSMAEIRADLSTAAEDLEHKMKTSASGLDLKIERLTVMVGTASVFMRCNAGERGPQMFSSAQHESSGQSFEASESSCEKGVASSRSSDVAKIESLVTTLATAVQAMQNHLAKTMSTCSRVRESCRSECDGLRTELARHEVRFIEIAVSAV